MKEQQGYPEELVSPSPAADSLVRKECRRRQRKALAVVRTDEPMNETAAWPVRHFARLTFVSFLLTFITSRTLVILIMSRRLPDFFLHLGGTHVHHLDYGILLLATVAGVTIFTHLNEAQRSCCALVYGIGMALTFDEFGMWLHLGGSYWQRASYDAVVVVLAVLGLLAFAPRWGRIRAHHFAVGGVVLLAVAGFALLLTWSLNHAQERFTPALLRIEQNGPK